MSDWRSVRKALTRTAPAAVFAVLLTAIAAVGGAAGEGGDPLAAEIERWSVYLKNNPSTDDMWAQVKQSGGPMLVSAEEAMKNGRRLLALQRLAAVRVNFAASDYLAQRPEADRQPAAFEAEWARMGGVLRDDLGAVSPAALDGVRPAAVRAIGEAALPQVRELLRGQPRLRPQHDDAVRPLLSGRRAGAAGFCRLLPEALVACGREPLRRCGRCAPSSTRSRPSFSRRTGRRPSIDRHSEFITASSASKEARELDAAGLRYGALLRYLQAVLRFAPLGPALPPLDAAALGKRIGGARLAAVNGKDRQQHRPYLLRKARSPTSRESSQRKEPRDGGVDRSASCFRATLRRSSRPRPEARRPAPLVTVTLVRWPYT